MSLISIIIPAYNDTERLKKCIRALENQSLDKSLFEVIVVNNEPNETLDFGTEFQDNLKLKVVVEEKPGSYVARNKGIKEAENEIIGFTDSDMIPDNNWLECANLYFLNDQERKIGILTGPVPLFFKDPENLSIAEIYGKYTGFDFEGYAKEGACGAGNWFSYKDVLEEFGNFREDLKSNGDTELSLKISKKYEVKYVPCLTNRHPARYSLQELSFRYCRILGGTYQRRFIDKPGAFFIHILNFIFRRYRFSLKKFFTVNLEESLAIFISCNVINFAALREYFLLVSGKEAKR